MPKSDKEKAASAKVLLNAFAAHKKKLDASKKGKVPKIVRDAPKGPKKRKKSSSGKGAATSALDAEAKRRKSRKKGKHAQLGSDEFSPSERAAKRKREGSGGPSLARTLTSIAASAGPGKGKIGAAISGGLSGAAIGATIGEAKDARRKRAREDKASTERDRKKKKDGGAGSKS